ncbi:MAG: hypothetical protein IKQ61_09405, partial [Spirochaetales bacterium]|nr:hypothetical protein [Spirochaetales bacterium]
MKKNYYVLLFVLTMYGLFAQTAHKPTVVVAPFDVCEQVKEKEANALLTRFQSELSRTKKVSVVDRKSLDKIKEQLAFQSTDWSDSDKVAELGRALNANMVIIGEITDVFDMLNITINMIDVNTTVIIASVIKEGENSKVLYDKLSDMAQELVDNMENSASIIPKEQSSIKDNKKTVNEVASVATTVQEKIVYRSPKTKTLGYTHIKNEAAFVMLLMFGTMSIVVSTSCMIAGGACDSYNLYKI